MNLATKGLQLQEMGVRLPESGILCMLIVIDSQNDKKTVEFDTPISP